ncbi:S-methylmethionine-dependent homocysteine/selenocysteine methylase [Rhodoligotrophos appendicifer]
MPLVRPGQRWALEAIYRSYLEIAAETQLPMQLGTPTWRAHPDCLARLGFGHADDLARINGAAVRLLHDLRRDMGLEYLIAIAGVIGPRRDGYDPAEAPSPEVARAYHSIQAEMLAELGVDLLYAPTFASAAELEGVAAAMAAAGLPYALAPIIDAGARMLDGTPLAEAIARIDARVKPAPQHYLIGCVHPTLFREAYQNGPSLTAAVAGRIAGLKANASTLPPDQLDRLDHLEAGLPQLFGEQMADLHRRYGLTVLGGCCGTDHRHIRAIAEALLG